MHDGIALGGDLNVIRSGGNGIYLSYYLNGPKKFDIAKVAQGDTVVHLYSSQLEKLKIAIPSKLEQKKETAAAHSGISKAEVEAMPFDLTALEQAGIFLNIDATGFSVLSRQLDWQSLGIELPKEQTVHLRPPRTGLLPDDWRCLLAAPIHSANRVVGALLAFNKALEGRLLSLHLAVRKDSESPLQSFGRCVATLLVARFSMD